jgi:hypothetical protein
MDDTVASWTLSLLFLVKKILLKTLFLLFYVPKVIESAWQPNPTLLGLAIKVLGLA